MIFAPLEFKEHCIAGERYCFSCGRGYHCHDFNPENMNFHCSFCGAMRYFTPPLVGAAVIPHQDDPYRVVLGRRGIPPEGKLDLPGGFFRYGRDPWAEIRREVSEECGGLVVTPRWVFHTSTSQVLLSDGIHQVVALFFVTAPVDHVPNIPPTVKMEMRSCEFIDVRHRLPVSEFAFPADYDALGVYALWVDCVGVKLMR